jgi:DNA-binding GntR family transcriptional regulator
MTSRPMRLEPPKSLAQQVAARLREAIVNGEFKLGEESLASTFGVSRTPVREALNLLQVEGLVNVRPQRGSYVFEPDETDLLSLGEFRCLIEPRAAQLAYALDKEGLVQTLALAVHEMEIARVENDPIRSSKADTLFHEAIIQRCGNHYIQNAYALAGARIASLRVQLVTPTDIISQEGIEHHRSLLSSLSEANWERFDELMREHIVSASERNAAKIRALKSAGSGSGT